MSGRYSRNKGKRTEYTVIDYFRQLGYTAFRVPLSGSAQGDKGDIKIEIPNSRYGDRPMDAKFLYAEVKCRAEGFETIYKNKDKLLLDGIAIDNTLVVVKDNFSDLGLLGESVAFNFRNMDDIIIEKTRKKIARMKELLKGCDFLIIKSDRKPLLFLRYF